MNEQRDNSDNNILTSSFTPVSEVIVIPKSSYQPKKSCPFCHSYYLTDTHCEACGKSLVYDPVGELFSEKSYFAIKERYIEDFDIVKRFYPVFESIHSVDAKKFVRRLKKRLIDLLDYFQFRESFYDEDSLFERRVFFVECQFIIEELLNYDQSTEDLLSLIDAKANGVLKEELIRFLLETSENVIIDRRTLWQRFGDTRIYHTVQMKTLITLFLFAGSLFGASLLFKSIYF